MRRRTTPFTTHSPLFWCVWDLYNWFFFSVLILPMKVFESISYLKKNVSKKTWCPPQHRLNDTFNCRPAITDNNNWEGERWWLKKKQLKEFFKMPRVECLQKNFWISNTRATFSIFSTFSSSDHHRAGASGTLKNISLLNSRTKSDDDKATEESEKNEIQLKKLWNIPAELNQWKSAHTNVAITLPKLEFS